MPDTIDALVRGLSDDERSVSSAAEDGRVALRLREIRRQGPASLRSRALEVLVDLDGEEFLDEARSTFRGTPCADQAPGRTSALGLHGLRPVTTAMGVGAATEATNSLEFQDSQGETQTAYRVFTTPEFESWRSSTRIREAAIDEDEAEEYGEGVPFASSAADNLSVEPGPVLAAPTHEHGWLATTHPDVPNSRFKGALPICPLMLIAPNTTLRCARAQREQGAHSPMPREP